MESFCSPTATVDQPTRLRKKKKKKVFCMLSPLGATKAHKIELGGEEGEY